MTFSNSEQGWCLLSDNYDNDDDDYAYYDDNYDDVAVEIQQTGVVPPFSCCQLRLPRAGIDNDNTPGSTMMINMVMVIIMTIIMMIMRDKAGTWEADIQ